MSYPAVRNWLVRSTVIEPSLLEGAGFESLVGERIDACGGTESAYIATLDHTPEEVDRLIAGIAVPETWLFRYPRSYDLLVEFLRARLASGADVIRMMSIGCATGQEPHCMAMCALHAGWPPHRIIVEGIDRNQNFLRTAARGEYGASSVRSELPPWAMPFLRRTGETITIDPSVRSVVRFSHADVTASDAVGRGGPRDVIFCRNLLIYLNAQARERLLDAICTTLVPGGLLFTGHAEQILRSVPSVRPVAAPHTFALERVDAASTPQAPRAVVRTTPHRRVPPPVASAPIPRADTSAGAVGSPEPSLDDARDLADAGRTQDAQTLIGSIIARRGPSACALELLGMIRMAADDTAGAKRFFEQAVYLEPMRSTSLLQLAMIAERAGDAPKAAALWDRARSTASEANGGARA